MYTYTFWQIEEVHRGHMRLVDIPTMTKGHSPWSDVDKVVVTTLLALYRSPLKDVKSMLVKGASHSVRRDFLSLYGFSRVSLGALRRCRPFLYAYVVVNVP